MPPRGPPSALRHRVRARHDSLYPVNALHIATLALAALLAVAAVAKLREDDAIARAAWIDLDIPVALRRRALRRAHPIGELALAVLALLPGVLSLLGALGMLVLTLVYLGVIVRVVRRPEPVACACFGEDGGVVSGRTVERNLLLVALGGCAVAAAALTGGPFDHLGDQVMNAPLALAVGLLALAAGWFSGPGSASAPAVVPAPAEPASDRDPADEDVAGGLAGDDAEDDYVRTLTPRARVTTAEGAVTDLLALSQKAPQLLVFGSPGCSSCLRLSPQLAGFRARLPQVEVRMVTSVPLEELREQAPEWVDLALLDADATAASMLQVLRTPTAFLLGTDGMLAGGPVVGTQNIADLVDDIAEALAEGGVPAPEPAPEAEVGADARTDAPPGTGPDAPPPGASAADVERSGDATPIGDAAPRGDDAPPTADTPSAAAGGAVVASAPSVDAPTSPTPPQRLVLAVAGVRIDLLVEDPELAGRLAVLWDHLLVGDPLAVADDPAVPGTSDAATQHPATDAPETPDGQEFGTPGGPDGVVHVLGPEGGATTDGVGSDPAGDADLDVPDASVPEHPVVRPLRSTLHLDPRHVTSEYSVSGAVTRMLIALHRGRFLLLHGAVVARDGRALALLAPSGTGKSHAARHLGAAPGVEYLSDETVIVDPGTSMVLPFPKPLSQVREPGGWAKSDEALPQAGLTPATGPVPLAGIVELVRDRDASDAADASGTSDDGVRLERLDLAEALRVLAPQTSSLAAMDGPLDLLAALLDTVGGLHRVTYRDVGDAEALLWQVLDADAVRTPRDHLPGRDSVGTLLEVAPFADALVLDDSTMVLDAQGVRDVTGFGAVVWETLAESGPLTTDGLRTRLEERIGAHPEAGALIDSALRELADAGLVLRHEADGTAGRSSRV